jgi:hypothetical protein
MEIQLFDATQALGKDKIFYQYGNKIYQGMVDSYNAQGYKLYYYKNFELIEILSVRKEKWNLWCNQNFFIFFLNDAEYKLAMKGIGTSKALYDSHIEAANIVAQVPISVIYHNILKVKE